MLLRELFNDALTKKSEIAASKRNISVEEREEMENLAKIIDFTCVFPTKSEIDVLEFEEL